jgi:hypothetical protein
MPEFGTSTVSFLLSQLTVAVCTHVLGLGFILSTGSEGRYLVPNLEKLFSPLNSLSGDTIKTRHC